MWPDAPLVAALIERASAGDSAAIDELLARHREAIRRIVELRLDPRIARRVDASDIVQDVLIEAHRRAPEYLRNPQFEFGLWLRQIARDRVIDAYRRHRGAARRSVDREQGPPQFADRSALDLSAVLWDHQATPATQAMAAELQRRFAAALEQLDETDREVLIMRHQEQLTNSEVARVLNLSEPAAGMRYLRALRRLRSQLGETPSQAGFG
ncbi:MAG: sigma-70 family RNA polymerase sigma factor [Planctomycetaceae bacterium]|nr:sigma-70 family RNA polymerase sigma factor [Planctomycetaceae bacterium]